MLLPGMPKDATRSQSPRNLMTGTLGAAIPLPARITNIADQYDALRTERPYKPPFDHEKAFKIITEGDNRTMPGHFDPQILQAFKDTHNQFKEIYETHKD